MIEQIKKIYDQIDVINKYIDDNKDFISENFYDEYNALNESEILNENIEEILSKPKTNPNDMKKITSNSINEDNIEFEDVQNMIEKISNIMSALKDDINKNKKESSIKDSFKVVLHNEQMKAENYKIGEIKYFYLYKLLNESNQKNVKETFLKMPLQYDDNNNIKFGDRKLIDSITAIYSKIFTEKPTAKTMAEILNENIIYPIKLEGQKLFSDKSKTFGQILNKVIKDYKDNVNGNITPDNSAIIIDGIFYLLSRYYYHCIEIIKSNKSYLQGNKITVDMMSKSFNEALNDIQGNNSHNLSFG